MLTKDEIFSIISLIMKRIRKDCADVALSSEDVDRVIEAGRRYRTALELEVYLSKEIENAIRKK